ncbi:RNA polymerase sigma factor [Anabaena sp. UHCC 0187]|uniref:RNA polymerase sigma factor n=1 Tax=Anabaena sp. UHCC 0187 TaxID=2590018 RepID=UPI001447651D|nr:RNA polymerase sigma factor [Anabaena sp. UHCC 0187]MTJ12172.1 RNA polymerase sigma factor [Anabaena sp. UHCC 0187]
MYSSNSSLPLYPDDQEAFWPLWQQYEDYLYRCCIKWTDNIADAEDALSRAMFKAWDKIPNSPVEIKNYKAWLSQLTYNLCVDIHREHHRGGKQVESLDTIGFEEQEIASQEETPVLVATQQELENFFCFAIDELPIRLRETFILNFKEELSYQEIEEKLNISYDNVRKRISQARVILKKRYHQDFIGEDISKDEVYSQSRNSNTSNNTHQLEVSITKTVVLSDELEVEEVEEAIKEFDVNDECLAGLDVLENRRIGKNRLSRTLKWCNFHSRQDVYPTIINAILFYLLYYQVFWQKWGDSGGRRSPTSFFIISINRSIMFRSRGSGLFFAVFQLNTNYSSPQTLSKSCWVEFPLSSYINSLVIHIKAELLLVRWMLTIENPIGIYSVK